MKNRILVVEDDDTISKLLYINLFAAGYEVLVCQDGMEVERLLAKDDKFDLVLLDMMLPGKNGMELLPEFNERDIPVIFLTGKGDVFSKVEGLKGGAEDYIVKPFEILELLVRVEMVLKRREKLLETFECGALKMDLRERTVELDGKKISLKPMEFDLLAVLAKNKNIALSREKLLNQVWGEEFLGETRTVDVHIAQLRKKLGDKVNISTVSKVGYRLEG